MNTITIGVDLAKNTFSTCAVSAGGRVLDRRDLKRQTFALWLSQVPAGTIIAMETCGGAHFRARRCRQHGLVPRLMAAHFVTPFRKSRLAKNNRNDAEAIATAARQGSMRFVPVKDGDQQTRLAWHRAREGYKTQARAMGNRIRGLLTEFGVVATVGNARVFKNGRQMAAWLGLVPTQHSSGGHARLGRISCRGDSYLRTLLIQGARSSLQRAKAVATDKATPEQLWIRELDRRMPFDKVLVAIANKHARQIWAMLAHEVDYDPCASVHHPVQQPRVAA